MGGVCRMGKRDLKPGNLKGIYRLVDTVEDEETVFKGFLKFSERWCGNMQWIALRHSRGTDWPL
jgi:hypothetical protein